MVAAQRLKPSTGGFHGGRPPGHLHKPERPPEVPSWENALPACIIAVDTETTGLHESDRIVTFAAIRLETECLLRGVFDVRFAHLIFNPHKTSHPRAEDIHGFSHQVLENQNSFRDYAIILREFLESGNVIVAHGAAFDIGVINRELILAGLAPLDTPSFCTMEAYRRAVPGHSSSLDSICGIIGLSRAGDHYGAIEDAWLAMNVFLWEHGCRVRAAFPHDRADMGLSNLRKEKPRRRQEPPRETRLPKATLPNFLGHLDKSEPLR